MIPVKVHFYRGTGFIGRAIRFFSWGEQSHVAMQINNTLYEAKEFHGVIRTKYPEAAQRKPDWTLTLEADEQQVLDLIHWWQSHIGKSYDYRGVFRFISRRKEDHKTKDKYFCSEAVCDACEFAGIPLFNRVDGSKVPPSWVFRSLRLKEKEE